MMRMSLVYYRPLNPKVGDMQYNFEQDPVKAQVNVNKHGVTFEQATGVFKDPMALTVFDEDNSSDEEDRWITLGQANGQHYLVVVHT